MVAAAVEAEEEAAALRRSVAAEAQVAGSIVDYTPSHLISLHILFGWRRVVSCGKDDLSLVFVQAGTCQTRPSSHVTLPQFVL